MTQPLIRGRERVGKYEIVEKIGEGGYGAVYRAYDPLIKRQVAIKTCSAGDAETRERFYREAEIAGSLDHPNIVTLHDLGIEEDTPYIVQELLGGEDLDHKIERREFLPFPEKLLYLIQIARGLDYAHARGVVHRDVKPANVRVLDDGTAKILDFGIAKLMQLDSRLTRADLTLGTAAYLAPEQIHGEAAGPRTDIFSFGVLAYELLTGERPFGRETISATFFQILNREPPPLDAARLGCPPGLVALIGRCLHKNPEHRPANCAELVAELEEIRDGLREAGSHGTPAAATMPLPRRPRRPEPRRSLPLTPAPDARDPLEPPDLPLRPLPTGFRVAGVARRRARRRWPLLAALLLLVGAAWLWTERERLESLSQPLLAVARAALIDAGPDGAPDTGPGAGPGSPPGAGNPPDSPPPPAAEAAPPPAEVLIQDVWSPGIRLSVDGGPPRMLGRSQSVPLEAGRHSLTFSLAGGGVRLIESVRLEVAAGERRRLRVPLRPPGRLTVQARIGSPQAWVSIDGGALRPTPLRADPLAAGAHSLRIFPTAEAAGRHAAAPVEVVPGRETVVTFDLANDAEPVVRLRPTHGERP